MIVSVGCLDIAGYDLENSHGVARIIGENGLLEMLGFKNKNNVYVIQRFFLIIFFTMSSTSHDIVLPEHTFNLTIIPKTKQSNPSTPNRVSLLPNTSTPQENILSTSSYPLKIDNDSPLQLIIPIMDIDDTIISGPFSDKNTFF